MGKKKMTWRSRQTGAWWRRVMRSNLTNDFLAKDTMTTLVRSVLLSFLLLVVDSSPVCAEPEADATGSAAAPAASTTSVRRAAHKFADASIGLELEYKVDNADVCVAWPEQMQDASCGGIDLKAIGAYVGASELRPLSVALLRYANGMAIVTVVHVSDGKTMASQREIDDFLNGVLGGMKTAGTATFTMSGSTPGSRYDVIKINDLDALRFEVKGDAPRGTFVYAMSRTVGYVFLGKHGPVMITALTDPQHLPQTRVAMESIVKSVRMPKSAQKVFRKSSTVDRLLDSEWVPFFLVLLVVGLLSVQSYFWRRKRKIRSR